MQTVHSVYLMSEWALELLFTVQSTGDGLPGKFTFCPSISPQRTGLILFFFIAACRNWFLVVYYKAECLRAVSADTVCWLVPGETESCGRNIIKNKKIKTHTKDASCSQNSSIVVFLSCLFFPIQAFSVEQMWVEMMRGIIRGQGLWLLHSKNIDGVHDSCPHLQYHLWLVHPLGAAKDQASLRKHRDRKKLSRWQKI